MGVDGKFQCRHEQQTRMCRILEPSADIVFDVPMKRISVIWVILPCKTGPTTNHET